MSSNEKLTIPELEPQEVVVDETKDLLKLYEIDSPKETDIRDALAQHHTRFGRIGFNSALDEQTVKYFLGHFSETPKVYLATELEFIKAVTSAETKDLVASGFERARSFLPEQVYKQPQMVMLLNGKRTDAKVIGTTQFGVNLQNLFGKVSTENGEDYNMQEAYEQLYDISAHEGSHIYLKQIEHSESGKVDWVAYVAFGEGLAVFSETKFNYPWSNDYLAEAAECLAIAKAKQEETTEKEKIQIINRVCEMDALKKYKPDFIERAQEQIADGLSGPNEFDNILRDLLVKKNGPLYYAGYSVWKRIQNNNGIDGIREIVKKGPKTFAEFM